jgi:hypothetical protein
MMAERSNRRGLNNKAQNPKTKRSTGWRFGARRRDRRMTNNCCRRMRFSATTALIPRLASKVVAPTSRRRTSDRKHLISFTSPEIAVQARGGGFDAHGTQIANSYSFPDVVHRLSKGIQVRPAAQTVNNVVAEPRSKMIFSAPACVGNVTLGSALVRTCEFARSTSPWRLFDQSRNPNVDTHTQVPTPHVSHYTNCAPCSLSAPP